MRHLHTALSAGVLAVSMACPANAQTTTVTAENTVHPVLETRPPREVLNSDLLALPERERQAWIHGAVAQMATVLASKDAVTTRCVMDWYFNVGNAAETIPQVMRRFPDAPASATILSLARRVCPDA